jgi:hypothetical protein
MKANLKPRQSRIFAGVCLLGAGLALTSAVILPAAEFYYAATTATLTYTTVVGPIPITGLTLTLPAADTTFNAAVITLNMPNLTLSQPVPALTVPMAGMFQIVAPASAAGPVLASGMIGADNNNVTVSGSRPLTMVVKMPLGTTSQSVQAEWWSNGAIVTTRTFASLSAILVKE